MTASKYFDIKNKLIEIGYAEEIDWQTNIQPCDDVGVFVNETIWVILNSGMKEQIARQIWDKINEAWKNGNATETAFRHKGKVKAIDHVCSTGWKMFDEYLVADDKISYLKTIPFIGDITKYHLAKNLGHDCVKPDRHLVRIAKEYGFSDCFEMCAMLSKQTGDKVSVIDIVLWRAANLKLI